DRRQGRTQGVAHHDGTPGKPLGTRGANVVVVDHLQHGRARVARQQADVAEGEYDRGHDEVPRRVGGGCPLTLDHRVDREETGVVRGLRVLRVEATGAGQ